MRYIEPIISQLFANRCAKFGENRLIPRMIYNIIPTRRLLVYTSVPQNNSNIKEIIHFYFLPNFLYFT